MYSTYCETPVGRVMIASNGKEITGLWMVGHRYFGGTMPENMIEAEDLPIFDSAKKWIVRYFNGERPGIEELPLAPSGSEFRKMVWNILCEIPYGECVTYGDIARTAAERMGKDKMSSRAVGGAVGHNPISIIIPCHRVIGSDGSLTGYGGGLDCKIMLLEHEGIDTEKMVRPTKGTAL